MIYVMENNARHCAGMFKSPEGLEDCKVVYGEVLKCSQQTF